MSRLTSLSPAALKAMFSTESTDSLISLLTLSGSNIAQPINLSDSYTHKFEYLTGSTMTVTDIAAELSYVYTYLASDEVVQEAINGDQANAVYGVMSSAVPYMFLPFNLTLPTEEQNSAPRCSITMNDVTKLILPVMREITSAPNISIKLVLSATPSVIEAVFPGFKMSGVTYNANTISGELTVESLAVEPFPAHTFTPSYFPGLF